MAELTKERLLIEAAKHPIFAHKYKNSHELRRKLTRRMCKDGLLIMIERNNDGFLYRAANHQERQYALLRQENERPDPR